MYTRCMSSKKTQDSNQTFKTLGLIFGALGVGLLLTGDSMRATGIPFLAIAVVFVAVGFYPTKDTPTKK